MLGWIFYLSFLAAAVVILVSEVRRRKPRRPGPESACGRCGYSVRELTTMICPECGCDLRVVGITPAARSLQTDEIVQLDPARLPTKTATILLTDIKDYTARAAKSSRDDVLHLLRRHRDTIQPVVNRHSGRIIKSTGDGVIAAFDSATEAVLAAGEIQGAIESNNRGAFTERDKILLRIGISTGEVAFFDDDVLGHPVNIASRVQQLAQPGQVCFTDSTFHAMSREEIACEDLGPVEVKGLEEKIRLYRYTPPAQMPLRR
jgi:class 3 adenylate cyclase